MEELSMPSGDADLRCAKNIVEKANLKEKHELSVTYS
jgi:hypothetical protein